MSADGFEDSHVDIGLLRRDSFAQHCVWIRWYLGVVPLEMRDIFLAIVNDCLFVGVLVHVDVAMSLCMIESFNENYVRRAEQTSY